MSGNLYMSIVDKIEGAIKSGDLKEGIKLPSERCMAEKYDVSRNVVREAYKILNEKGLVNIYSGKGAFVSTPKANVINDRLEDALSVTESNLYDILEVREILETAVAKKAVIMATKEDIEKLEKAYNEMELYVNNPVKFAEIDSKFHVELANCTGNPTLVLLINTFNKITDKKLFMLNNIYPNRAFKAQKEHRIIIDAIKDRDEKRILLAINSHINCIESELTILSK